MTYAQELLAQVEPLFAAAREHAAGVGPDEQKATEAVIFCVTAIIGIASDIRRIANALDNNVQVHEPQPEPEPEQVNTGLPSNVI